MKIAVKIVLAFIVAIHLAACGLYPPNQSAWVSVEAPPNRTIVVMDADDVTKENLECIIGETMCGEFQPYKFNESISVTASGSVNRKNENIDTKNATINLTK